MPSRIASLKHTAAAAAAAAVMLSFVPLAGHATTQIVSSAPPSDLKATIGFMTLVQLPCAYSPALSGSGYGHMTLFNPTSKHIARGRPVTYRLSATGEDFTVHLKTEAGPRQVTRVPHRHAEVSRCEAWTYIR